MSRYYKSNGFISRKILQSIKKIFNICKLRITDSTEEEQNNEHFIQNMICETIEVVYQTSFNLLGAFGRKKIKELENDLKEINNNINCSPFIIEL